MCAEADRHPHYCDVCTATTTFPFTQQVLQHEIRKTHAKSQAHEWIEELTLMEIVGKGGFGVVYKGTWKGSIAAVKVR